MNNAYISIIFSVLFKDIDADIFACSTGFIVKSRLLRFRKMAEYPTKEHDTNEPMTKIP